MPVSSPSYFPPQRAGDTIVGLNAGIGLTNTPRTFLAGLNAGTYVQNLSDLIIIGDSAFAAGTAAAPITDTNLIGLMAIGSQAAKNVTQALNVGFGFGPSTVIGYNALTAAGNSNYNTVIGSNALAQYSGNNAHVGTLVAIGEQVGLNLSQPNPGSGNLHSTVMIGFQACSSTGTAAGNITQNVIIGQQAVSNIAHSPGTGGNAVVSNVAIGFKAGLNLANNDSATGAQYNVIVGASAGADAGSVQGCVYLGAGMSGTVGTGTNNVGVGSSKGGTLTAGTNGNILIGSEALNVSTNNRCIVLGYGAWAGGGAITANDQFVVETVDGPPGGTRRALLYGILGTSVPNGLIIGHSTTGTDRDIPNGSKNIVKLLSGTVGGVAPLGGGYFYIDGGNNSDMPLHWVNATAQDTALGPSGPLFEATGLGVITPATLAAGATNDYAPGLAQVQTVRISGNAGGSTLNGIAGGTAGRRLRLLNVGANAITIAHQAAGSAAANRFSLPGAANLTLSQFSDLTLWYDTTLANWVSISRSN